MFMYSFKCSPSVLRFGQHPLTSPLPDLFTFSAISSRCSVCFMVPGRKLRLFQDRRKEFVPSRWKLIGTFVFITTTLFLYIHTTLLLYTPWTWLCRTATAEFDRLIQFISTRARLRDLSPKKVIDRITVVCSNKGGLLHFGTCCLHYQNPPVSSEFFFVRSISG